MNENWLCVSNGESTALPVPGERGEAALGPAGVDPACAGPGVAAWGKGRKQPCLLSLRLGTHLGVKERNL